MPKGVIWLPSCQAELFISLHEEHQTCTEQMLFAADKGTRERWKREEGTRHVIKLLEVFFLRYLWTINFVWSIKGQGELSHTVQLDGCSSKPCVILDARSHTGAVPETQSCVTRGGMSPKYIPEYGPVVWCSLVSARRECSWGRAFTEVYLRTCRLADSSWRNSSQ